jgi:hypothetical protein
VASRVVCWIVFFAAGDLVGQWWWHHHRQRDPGLIPWADYLIPWESWLMAWGLTLEHLQTVNRHQRAAAAKNNKQTNKQKNCQKNLVNLFFHIHNVKNCQ